MSPLPPSTILPMPLGSCFTTGSASPGEGLFLLVSPAAGDGLFALVDVAGGDRTLLPSSEGKSGLGRVRCPLFSNTLLYT